MVMIEQGNVIFVKLKIPQFIQRENYQIFLEIYYLCMFPMKIQGRKYLNH